MRVLMLSHMYPSAVNPTAGIFVDEQVRALRALGHDVRVVSPTGWAPPLVPGYRRHRQVPGADVLGGVPVLYPRKAALPRNLLGHRNADAMLWAIGRPLRRVHGRWPFQVIHAHMLVPDGWAAACLGAELEVPVLATAHRADVLDVPARGGRARLQVARAVEAIDQIVTVSARIRAAAEELGRTRRPVRVVPNGADTRVFQPHAKQAARARLGLPHEPTITYVGKLEPRKAVNDLLSALALLARRPQGAPRLALVGVGSRRAALERQARELGVADRVRFAGKAAHEEVPWWIAAGDVFVLPSLSEGLPTVVCEAMSCARPVVATAVDGTPEIVRDGDTGLLVPPRDPDALAAALARVLDDPDLAARMGARALEVGRAEYTWAVNAARTSALYEELVSSGWRA